MSRKLQPTNYWVPWGAGPVAATSPIPPFARKAVTIAVEARRSLDIESASDLRALEFEEMIKRAGLVFTASKNMLGVYGLNVDAMLDSVTAETLSQEGDQVRVRARFRFLETSQKIDIPMVRKNGRWYTEDSLNINDDRRVD